MSTSPVNITQTAAMPIIQNMQNKAASPVQQNTQATQPKETTKADKGDTLIIAGHEIKKKDALKYGGILAAGTSAIITAGAAFKKGKIVNGENSKFFSNMSEGLKAIFTKAGKEKYKKALETVSQNTTQDVATTAGKGKGKLFNRKGKHKAPSQSQPPLVSKEDAAKGLIADYNKGDKEAQKLVNNIVNNAQDKAIKEKTDKIYKKLEPEISEILGDNFKNALIEAQKKTGTQINSNAVINLGKEFSKDELKTIMAAENGVNKLIEYIQTEQLLSNAAEASKKLLHSIVN